MEINDLKTIYYNKKYISMPIHNENIKIITVYTSRLRFIISLMK